MANKALLGILASAGLLVSASAQAVVIDTFDSGNGSIIATNNAGDPLTCVGSCSQTFATNPGDALNNAHTLSLLAGAAGSAVTVSGGVLSVGSLNAPTTATVGWDAGANASDFVDLTADGSTGIIAKILAIDVGLVDLTFDVTGTGGEFATLTLSNLNVGNAEFSYALFSGDQLALSNAHSILLTITGTGVSTDLQLDFLTTIDVPEPASLGLLGAGLLGLGLARRRRR